MKKALFISLIIILSTSKQSQAQNIYTVAGNGTGGYTGDGGQATAAELVYPSGVALDVAGNLYIADFYTHCVRMISTAGIISTIAGTGSPGYTGDGGNATAAELYSPYGVALDAFGNVYIADLNNNCIRQVNTAGIISTIAGNGTTGYTGDGGQATAAQLNGPVDIITDAANNIYFADELNNCIRKINTSGIITTIAGTGATGYSGDGGQATAAELKYPSGVAIDMIGNIYVADRYNSCIRQINTMGNINTIVGSGTAGYTGDGSSATAAELNFPAGVAIDAKGNLYISDLDNNCIRKVNTMGIISTIAGNGTPAYGGDGSIATASEVNQPNGIAVDASGNLYIADFSNNRVRVINVPLTVNSDTICTGSMAMLTASGATSYSWSTGDTTAFISPTPTVTSTYSVTGLILGVTVSTAMDTVTVNPLPVVTISSGTNTLCIGSTTTLTASGASSYTWSNTATTGVSISPSPTITTCYTVTGTDINNCMNIDTLSITVENCTTDISTIENSNEVTIYPNPNNGSFVIEPNNTTKQIVQLYDINGKLVLSQIINGKTSIDAINLNEGVYNISLIDYKGVINKKLIIVR